MVRKRKRPYRFPKIRGSLRSLNIQLISMLEEREGAIDTYTDRLRHRNRELNRKLYTLITTLDNQAETVFRNREHHLKEAYELSTGYHRSGHNGHSPVDHILLDHPAGCVCQGGKPETIGRNDKTECPHCWICARISSSPCRTISEPL